MTMDKTVPAGEFKAKCLHLLDEVAQRRTPLVITKPQLAAAFRILRDAIAAFPE